MKGEKRFIQADDIYKMIAVKDVRVSPDGQWIAFVRVERLEHQNATRQTIWLVRPDGSDLRQFTQADGADNTPRWSPDGRWLAFVSDRKGKRQLFLIPVDGGEAEQLTFIPNGAAAPAWSPDGRKIAFLVPQRMDELALEDERASLPPATQAELDAFAKEREEGDKDRYDPRVVARVPFRSETSFWDERFAQIYIVSVEAGEDGVRRPRRLTSDARSYEAPEWSADGQFIYSAASRKPEHDSPWLFNAVVKFDAQTGDVVSLTGEGHACSHVRPSPDGERIAFLTRPDTLPVNRFSQIAVMPAQGGDIHILTEQFDRSIEQFEWLEDSRHVVLTARDAGALPIFKLDMQTGEVARLAYADRTAATLHSGGQSVIGAAVFSADGAYEIYAQNGMDEPIRLTHFSDSFLQEVQVSPPEHIRYAAPDGQMIDGWLMLPPACEAGEQYPLALNIHGGPSAMWGPSDPGMWLEWQHHAASGYVVFYCNPRGSTGYDEAFMQANRVDWGDGPASDVLTGVDLVVARGLVDPARLAITGGSYGGYLTAWIIGHDDRFAAAVAQRGVYHLLAFHGTTDIPLFMSSNMDAEPWEDPAIFWKLSPLAYAENIRTPLLIIHSENDFRVPIAEGEQLFTTLKRLGATVEMVRYPREGHELSRSGEPKHIVDRLERIVGWWDRYCKPEAEQAS